jgi:hypothetical protein
VPPAYESATYKTLEKATWVNATHWQYTIKCSGCTYYGDEDIGITNLNPNGQNPLALAYSANPVDTPSSNASSFSIHDGVGHWYHDFATAKNKNFASLVTSNS